MGKNKTVSNRWTLNNTVGLSKMRCREGRTVVIKAALKPLTYTWEFKSLLNITGNHDYETDFRRTKNQEIPWPLEHTLTWLWEQVLLGGVKHCDGNFKKDILCNPEGAKWKTLSLEVAVV